MSLFQRIKDEEQREKKIKDEVESKNKRKEEIIRSHPDKLECKNLIPIVKSFLQKICNEFDLIMEQLPSKIPDGLSYFNVYRSKKKNIFFREKGASLFWVSIGEIEVNDKLEAQVTPITIYTYSRVWSRDINASSYAEPEICSYAEAKYNKPPTGYNDREINKWLEDKFYEKREKLQLKISK